MLAAGAGRAQAEAGCHLHSSGARAGAAQLQQEGWCSMIVAQIAAWLAWTTAWRRRRVKQLRSSDACRPAARNGGCRRRWAAEETATAVGGRAAGNAQQRGSYLESSQSRLVSAAEACRRTTGFCSGRRGRKLRGCCCDRAAVALESHRAIAASVCKHAGGQAGLVVVLWPALGARAVARRLAEQSGRCWRACRPRKPPPFVARCRPPPPRCAAAAGRRGAALAMQLARAQSDVAADAGDGDQ